MIETAIFLGAGASKAEGAPLQGELFWEYFRSPEFRHSRDLMDLELAAFFGEMFGVDVKRTDLRKEEFPTFEEVLGLTDLAILRKEAFRHFDIENRANNSSRLRSIAQYLVFLVAKVLDAKLRDRARMHRQLITKLHDGGELRKTVFVSTNYDILIDNALTEEYQHVDLDYGVEFRNFDRPNDWKRPRRSRNVLLFKPHGSLNWLYCPACAELEITPKEKAVTRLISEFADKKCAECSTVFSPMIVPPSFYKDLNNVFLISIWNRTDVTLRKVRHVIFCGYSFPDADIHIKYLLKRAQTNRDGLLRITVINNHPDKDPDVAEKEKQRYERFLGGNVDFTDLSFRDFAVDPTAVIRS
jgi:NAD-dependent SIR2 family protein deacetylase